MSSTATCEAETQKASLLRVAPEPGGFALIQKGLVLLWPHLPEHFIRLLPALLSFADSNTKECFPSQDRLAALVRRSRRSVWETLSQMESAGLVTKTARSDPKRRNANTSCLYRLADLNDSVVRTAIIAQLAKRLAVKPKTSQLSCAVQDFTATTPSCEAQDFVGGVKPKTSQGLCSPGLHSNVPLELTNLNVPPAALRCAEGAGAPGACSASALPPGAALPTSGAVGANATATRTPPAAQEPVEEWEALDDAIVPAEWEEDDQRSTVADAPPAATVHLPAAKQSEPVSADPEPANALAAIETPAASPAPVDAPKPKDADPAPSAAAGAKKSRRKAPGMTDAEKEQVCSNIDAMEAYLTKGRLNWRQFVNLDAETFREKSGADNWAVEHFMGFTWFRVSKVRAALDQKLTLPDWGRLGAEIKRALDPMTKYDLAQFIDTMTEDWDLVRFMIGGTISVTLALNESTINHKLVQNAVEKIQGLDKEDRAAWLRKMHKEWDERVAA